MTEETALRIAVALEAIAQHLDDLTGQTTYAGNVVANSLDDLTTALLRKETARDHNH